MFRIINIILSLIAVFLVSSSQDREVTRKVVSEQTLAKMLLNSRSSPQVTKQCFQTYNPKLEALAENYENELNDCNENATNAGKAVDQEVEPNVAAVTESQHNMCNDFSACSNLNNGAYDFFNCSTEAASSAMTEAYNIQTISKDRMQYIAMKQQIIKYDHDTCKNKCEVAYNEEVVQVYGELQDCLAGKIIITTTTKGPSSTTTTSTTLEVSTTTPVRTSTTQEDTTAVNYN